MSVDETGHNLGQFVNDWTRGSFYNSTLLTTGAAFSGLYQTAVDGNAASLAFPLDKDLPTLIQNHIMLPIRCFVPPFLGSHLAG